MSAISAPLMEDLETPVPGVTAVATPGHTPGHVSFVFNVVTGLGPVVGAALCAHPRVAKLTFTGSPAAGRLVAAQAAERLVPVTMELGGKSANVVFPDADLDAAAAAVAAGFIAAGGQSCVAGSRVVVHESIYDDMIDRLAAHAKQVRMGDPRRIRRQWLRQVQWDRRVSRDDAGEEHSNPDRAAVGRDDLVI